MTEYINKAELYDRACDERCKLCDTQICEYLYGMPTIDIVHCGECKHRREHTEYDRKHDEYVTYAYCTQWQSYHCDDWFCADGERKE